MLYPHGLGYLKIYIFDHTINFTIFFLSFFFPDIEMLTYPYGKCFIKYTVVTGKDIFYFIDIIPREFLTKIKEVGFRIKTYSMTGFG